MPHCITRIFNLFLPSFARDVGYFLVYLYLAGRLFVISDFCMHYDIIQVLVLFQRDNLGCGKSIESELSARLRKLFSRPRNASMARIRVLS